ncbi:MAG: TetR family transcriptional regulator [Parvibaculaceae bacterium]|nr:TetR family transcriptional regulator [Parvibaculaceae bacterium]
MSKPAAKISGTGKSERTREALLLAGEELMGWKGIEATSVRDINQKAKQKNTSAIGYYFQNKEGLLQAILDRRMVPLDDERRRRWDALTAEKGAKGLTLRDLVEIQVLPLAEAVLAEPAWRNYVLLLAQLVSAHGAPYQHLWRDKYDKTSGEIIAAMRDHMPTPDDALWRQQVSDMITFSIGSLCERTYALGPSGKTPELSDTHYLSHLVLTATAILSVSQ